MNHLPLHLCSMPLYIYPILYFSKEGSKLEKYAKATAFVVVLAGALGALIVPGNIIGSNEAWFPFTDNFLPWVSFTFQTRILGCFQSYGICCWFDDFSINCKFYF